jgi:hypothetical protein
MNLRSLIFDCGCILVCLLIAAYDIRRCQFAPRHYVTSVNGHVISDEVLTNPVYVKWTTEPIVTGNGIEYRQVAKTNILWTQWEFWR